MPQIDVSMFNKGQIDYKEFLLSAEMSALEMMGENIPFVEPVTVELKVNGSESSIIAEGIVSGRLGLQCVRCLEPFDHSFNIPFREIYTRRATEDTDEEIQFSGDIIDLSPEVLKAVILSLPMKAICREDCQGLCPSCGSNLNINQCECAGESIDPRFNMLQDLFKE